MVAGLFKRTRQVPVYIVRTKYRSLCCCSWQLPVLALWSRIKNSSSPAPPPPPPAPPSLSFVFVFEGEVSGFSDTLLWVLVTGWLVGDITVL